MGQDDRRLRRRLRDYLLYELRDVLDTVGVSTPNRKGEVPHIPFWHHIINLD